MRAILLLLFIISFSTILSDSADSADSDNIIDTVYDFLIGIFKGMSNSDMAKCAGVLENQKKILKEYIEIIVEKFKSGEKFDEILKEYGIKIITIKGLAENCELFKAIITYDKISTVDGLTQISEKMENDSKVISEIIKKLLNFVDKDDKIVVLGKLLSIILDFNVK